jgi:predicted SAM-dependent methyltransferase
VDDLRLNLGSGTSPMHEYTNIDMLPEADVQHDLTTPLPYRDNSITRIYSSHVVEHFTRKEWEFVRRDWARVLKPGGEMEIRCPDIMKLAQHLVDNPGDPMRIQQIYGQQANPGQFHKNGFNEQILADSFPGFSYKLLKPSSDYELHMVLTK